MTPTTKATMDGYWLGMIAGLVIANVAEQMPWHVRPEPWPWALYCGIALFVSTVLFIASLRDATRRDRRRGE